MKQSTYVATALTGAAATITATATTQTLMTFKISEHPPSPVPHLAFEDAVAGGRRSSAPVSSSLEDGNSAVDIRPACPVGVHRHSIAVIADDSLPCGLVRPPTEVKSSSASNGESSRSSSATARWLEAIFHHLRARRRSNDESAHRRRQTDHP